MCVLLSFVQTENDIYHYPGVDSHTEIRRRAGLLDRSAPMNWLMAVAPDPHIPYESVRTLIPDCHSQVEIPSWFGQAQGRRAEAFAASVGSEHTDLINYVQGGGMQVDTNYLFRTLQAVPDEIIVQTDAGSLVDAVTRSTTRPLVLAFLSAFDVIHSLYKFKGGDASWRVERWLQQKAGYAGIRPYDDIMLCIKLEGAGIDLITQAGLPASAYSVTPASTSPPAFYPSYAVRSTYCVGTDVFPVEHGHAACDLSWLVEAETLQWERRMSHNMPCPPFSIQHGLSFVNNPPVAGTVVVSEPWWDQYSLRVDSRRYELGESLEILGFDPAMQRAELLVVTEPQVKKTSRTVSTWAKYFNQREHRIAQWKDPQPISIDYAQPVFNAA